MKLTSDDTGEIDARTAATLASYEDLCEYAEGLEHELEKLGTYVDRLIRQREVLRKKLLAERAEKVHYRKAFEGQMGPSYVGKLREKLADRLARASAAPPQLKAG